MVSLQGDRLLTANLGDSGVLVLRDGAIIFRAHEQQHRFNMPFQLGSGSLDTASDASTDSVQVRAGDVVVLATDGLFDNLWPEDITELVLSSDADPALLASELAQAASVQANSTTAQTPFADAAHRHAIYYRGGKLDDITVVVAVVTTPEQNRRIGIRAGQI